MNVVSRSASVGGPGRQECFASIHGFASVRQRITLPMFGLRQDHTVAGDERRSLERTAVARTRRENRFEELVGLFQTLLRFGEIAEREPFRHALDTGDAPITIADLLQKIEVASGVARQGLEVFE